MKEVYSNFSLTDFLAYLFPGAMTLIAVAGIVSLTPYKSLLNDIPPNLLTVMIIIALAYSVGVIISSLTVNFEERLFKRLRDALGFKPLKEIRPPESFKMELEKAFEKFLGGKEWTLDHFFAARSLMREKMPACSISFDRQSSLRQFRRNSIMPVLLLGFTGILAGSIEIVFINSDDLYKLISCIALILISALFTPIIIYFLIQGMNRNREREVREVCTALLVLYKYEEK